MAAESAVAPGPDDTWEFKPGPAPATPGPLDLRSLNEKVAGESGFVRLSKDGEGYVRGDGRPIRFWGAAANVNEHVTDADLAVHARFLARLGCNAVRVGGDRSGLIPQKPGQALTEVNESFVNDVWRLVAAMKKEGIYTRVAPFWDHGCVKVDPAWGIEGYGEGSTLNSLLFFEPKLQEAWKAWMKHLFTVKNPYTGIALKDDPAVALVQVVSEDTMLFYWADTVKGGPRRELEKRFGDFAAKKYGSIQKAIDTWGGKAVDGDAATEGRLGLEKLYLLFASGTAPADLRRTDQAEFMTRLEREFYTEAARYLREDLKVKCLINASNFGPANPSLEPLQLWSWSAADVMEFNHFFECDHKGKFAGWRIDPGDTFTPRSALKNPDLPTSHRRVAGKPFNLSSTTWIKPNPYRVEGPLLLAAYGSLQKVDGVFCLACNAPEYERSPFFPFGATDKGGLIFKWGISQPNFISQFPAAALIFRKRLVSPADVVVREEVTFQDMVGRKPLPALTPETFLAGRVSIRPDAPAGLRKAADLSPLVNREKGTVASTNKQLSLDTRSGLLRVNTPQAQGVAGFLKDAGGKFELADVRIQSQDDYSILIAVSLDGKPLSKSSRVLIQSGAIAAPTGWKTAPVAPDKAGASPGTVEILNSGKGPWMIRKTHAVMSLANPKLKHAAVLDEQGTIRSQSRLEPKDGRVEWTLPTDAFYTILSEQLKNE